MTQTTYDWMTIPTVVTPTSYSEKQNNPDLISQTDKRDDTVAECTMDVDPFNTTNVTGMGL